jgi:hypothetical protein
MINRLQTNVTLTANGPSHAYIGTACNCPIYLNCVRLTIKNGP